MIKTITGLVQDYAYLARHQKLFDSPLLPNNQQSQESPVILLPGVFEGWHIFDPLVVPLIDRGYPVYAPQEIGRSYDRVEDLARKVRQFILERDLHRITLVGHSKGGLVGKYVMSYMDSDHRIERLFAVATPFSGARIKLLLASGPLQELAVGSDFIQKLDKNADANDRIVNLQAAFDNHIWGERPPLPGAKNITVPIVGHHRILQHSLVLQTILDDLKYDSN